MTNRMNERKYEGVCLRRNRVRQIQVYGGPHEWTYTSYCRPLTVSKAALQISPIQLYIVKRVYHTLIPLQPIVDLLNTIVLVRQHFDL